MNPQLVPTSRLARLSLRMQSDERLAELVGRGSEAAFEAIVHRYRRALVRHCARVIGDADADEAVQEALLKAHRALAAGTTVRSLGPWLLAIAHNSALAQLAGRRVGAEYREDDVGISAGSDQLRREHLDALTGALLSLPARQRQALVMREFEGRSYDEIAARLGASHGAVRQLLNRARASVRERMGAVVPVELLTRWLTTFSSGPSRALTLAGSGAFAAKVSGAILLSAAPVVAVAPGPSVSSAPPPARHVATPATRAARAGRRVSVRLSASAFGRGEAPAAVRAEVDDERQRHEEPLEAGHVVSGAPGPECGVRQRRPRKQEEPEQRQDPAVEGTAEHVTENPQQEQDQPWGDQREQGEQTGHQPSIPAGPGAAVTQTG
ncbi:MAG TPA: RNA polymerase sigma factor [Solirubrobacteraceae bacterium]|nr:RNA polymerase sigma factor [Solirubrobacteraceae bacterium]